MAFLPTTTEPEALIEEYAAEVARRLGYQARRPATQRYRKHFQSLLNVLPPDQLTEEERIEAKARWDAIREHARQYRKEHP